MCACFSIEDLAQEILLQENYSRGTFDAIMASEEGDFSNFAWFLTSPWMGSSTG
jgi:hypothetical protein